MEALDEKGFVFIDGNGKPFWCCLYCGEPWIMRWHEGNKAWVTLRKINNSEIMVFHEAKIKDELAELYHALHRDFIGVNPFEKLKQIEL